MTSYVSLALRFWGIFSGRRSGNRPENFTGLRTEHCLRTRLHGASPGQLRLQVHFDCYIGKVDAVSSRYSALLGKNEIIPEVQPPPHPGPPPFPGRVTLPRAARLTARAR